MNDSVATTTNAEVKIQSRGFLTKLLFGGDTTSADVIKAEVAQNQQRIDDLTKLLAGANVSVDIKTTLSAQMTALQDAQSRLQDLAQKEQSTWGLFSWRF
jgi:Tfp pilus assembly protein PilN